jgi:hypothetical protein
MFHSDEQDQSNTPTMLLHMEKNDSYPKMKMLRVYPVFFSMIQIKFTKTTEQAEVGIASAVSFPVPCFSISFRMERSIKTQRLDIKGK